MKVRQQKSKQAMSALAQAECDIYMDLIEGRITRAQADAKLRRVTARLTRKKGGVL